MAAPELLPVGEVPPVGQVPRRMFAQVVRQGRFGDPLEAFQVEELDVPQPGLGEALIAVMAAGINFNNVWAARGVPIDVIAGRQRTGGTWDFHVGGSDASGVVFAVGSDVAAVKVGDRVVVHPGWWTPSDPWAKSGRDPMLGPTAKIWGYDAPTNFGSFGQFAIAQAHQLLPKPADLTWEESAASTLVGTTAYRMLHGWAPNVVSEGDVVLVWGGSGGVGSQAIQLAAFAGAIPVAVVSDSRRGEYCEKLGAAGYIDRSSFDHWGQPPHWDDVEGQREWSAAAREFGKKIWEIVGERRNPSIVIEHPGEATLPTSIFVCDRGGMVVICAGTTGYSGAVDLRYLWVQQKRLQGSHGVNDQQAQAYNEILATRAVDPCVGEVLAFDGLPLAHHEMGEGKEVFGNRVVLVGAPAPGLGVHDT